MVGPSWNTAYAAEKLLYPGGRNWCRSSQVEGAPKLRIAWSEEPVPPLPTWIRPDVAKNIEALLAPLKSRNDIALPCHTAAWLAPPGCTSPTCTPGALPRT